ncbi:hypothetical protein MMB17_07650 [Methylobacterium organophilum]|uniref:hypothetical protein n=1 Tax=Methylobacterium organophilum TaxID=410 RepID=UPI001F13A6C6|nr:hypothetical protein [Methylobacterium organophilum]UMY19163.1 hypothetical protein MMB17_07650 [Methylobacterium organophilum]
MADSNRASRPMIVADLHAQLQVMDRDLDTTVSAYIADPSTYPFQLEQGLGVDSAAAVESPPSVGNTLLDQEASRCRAALHRAILAAPACQGWGIERLKHYLKVEERHLLKRNLNSGWPQPQIEPLHCLIFSQSEIIISIL